MTFVDFTNSPLVGGVVAGLATIGTGYFAIKVFKLQKADEKTNAAISILFEIRNAEEKIDIIIEKINSGSTQDLPSVLPTNDWVKYSHLFSKDFDEDELKLINAFYNSCSAIEDLVTRQNNFIWIATQERAQTAQRLLGDIHIDFQKDMVSGVPLTDAQKKFESEKMAITKFYTDETYFYAPQKTLDGLKFQISRAQKITITTAGSKLKKLARF